MKATQWITDQRNVYRESMASIERMKAGKGTREDYERQQAVEETVFFKRVKMIWDVVSITFVALCAVTIVGIWLGALIGWPK